MVDRLWVWQTGMAKIQATQDRKLQALWGSFEGRVRMAGFCLAPHNLNNNTINKAEVRLARTALNKFHLFQRVSKAARAALCSVSFIASTANVCSWLLSGILILTVGH